LSPGDGDGNGDGLATPHILHRLCRRRPLIYNLICVLAEKVGETLSALRLTT